MDQRAVETLLSTVDLITTTLDHNPGAWRDRLQTIRSITSSLEMSDTVPDQSRRQWQVPLVSAFQQVAFIDADSGGVLDIADWCLKQELSMITLYPQDVELLTC